MPLMRTDFRRPPVAGGDVPGSRRRARARVAACAAVAVLGGGVTAAALLPGAGAAEHPNRTQGPATVAATVVGAAGKAVSCPVGATPSVKITAAYFTPRLDRGTTFKAGRAYRIRLEGTVVNETTSPIVVTDVLPTINGGGWAGATTTRPDGLAANSSGSLVIEGTFKGLSTRQAAAGASLRWHWSDSQLAPCGEKGLVDDD